MARYIDLDEAIKHLRGACIEKYPLSYSNGISAAVNEISKMPAAEVVPKSEVEMLQGALKAEERHNELTMEMAQKALKNAKAEVAREIFAEIESMLIRYTFDDDYISLGIIDEFSDFKNKYTEEKT